MTTPRIAVIGCGQWGRNHVRTLFELGALAGVADLDAARSEPLAERFGVPALSPEAAVAAPHVDALVLALPPALHGRFARAAFEGGKDALVEKPIALDVGDAERTAAAARQHGRLLMVGHVLRFHPVFERLAEVVASGRIGAIRHVVSIRFGLGRFLGMDAVWDLAPHDLSLVLAIAGSAPTSIETLRRKVLSDETDAATLALEFPNGASAEIHVSRVSPYRDRRFSVIGTDGMVTFDDLAPDGQKLAFYAHAVRRAGRGFEFRHADPEFIETEPGLPLSRELAHFIGCVAARRQPRTGWEEAVETVRILQLASPRA